MAHVSNQQNEAMNWGRQKIEMDRQTDKERERRSLWNRREAAFWEIGQTDTMEPHSVCVCVCVCECWMLGNLRSSGWYLNAFILFAKWKMHVVFGRRSGHKFSAVWTYKSYSRWPVCVCVEWWNTHIHTMSVIHMHTLETFSLNTQQHLYLWKKERDVGIILPNIII